MIVCTKFKSYEKGCLRGFADLKFTSLGGLIVHGCTLNMKDGKRWINFPSKEIQENGEKKYLPILRFEERGMSEKFSEAAKKAIDAFCSQNQPTGNNG